MSFFVSITFDLNNADTAIYSKIHQDFEQLDFSKFISGRKKTDQQLPSNTFVADFDSSEFSKSAELTDWVKSEIKDVFKKHSVKGNFFITAGQKWAWKSGKF